MFCIVQLIFVFPISDIVPFIFPPCIASLRINSKFWLLVLIYKHHIMLVISMLSLMIG